MGFALAELKKMPPIISYKRYGSRGCINSKLMKFIVPFLKKMGFLSFNPSDIRLSGIL